MALASVPFCLLFGETFALYPLALTAVLSFGVGQTLYWSFRKAPEMTLRHAMVTAALAWLIVPLTGAAFLIMTAHSSGPAFGMEVFRTPINAVFESVSGFTSTGLSVVSRPDRLPGVVQWWRSLSQWVGGAGVIVVILTVFHPKSDAERLFFSEAREQRIFPDVLETVKTIWWLYVSFTVLGIALLWTAGMPLWRAVNHAMTGIATGGFSTRENSMAGESVAVQVIMMGLMVMGAISFRAHYRILSKFELHLLWRDRETRALIVFLVCGALLLFLENLWHFGEAMGVDSVFQWLSALCTGGFQTTDLDGWSSTGVLMLATAMTIGGAAGSTTGGIKISRFLVVAQGLWIRVQRITLHPWRVMEHRTIADESDSKISGPQAEAAALIVGLWLLTLLAGVLAMLHVGDFELESVLVECASALGNVGLSSGLTRPGLEDSGKVILMLLMWMGRLEILPVLVLVAAIGRGAGRNAS